MSFTGTDDAAVKALLASWIEAVPALSALAEASAGEGLSFTVAGDPAGLEIACQGKLRGLPHRGRLKLVPYGEAGQYAVFFYRMSSSTVASDRFGYGGLAFRADRLRPDQVLAWLDFLVSGFAPESSPRGLQRAHQFPVPD